VAAGCRLAAFDQYVVGDQARGRRPRLVLNTDLQSEDEATVAELAQDLG